MNEKEFIKSNEEHTEKIDQQSKKDTFKNSLFKSFVVIALSLLLVIGITIITQNYDLNNIDGKNDNVIDNYVFGGDTVYIGDKTQKSKQIGLSMKSIIHVNKNEVAQFVIKNTGSIDIRPVIKFNDEIIYKAPILNPGQAVEANVDFGDLDTGEYLFETIANINHNSINSTGILLNCKLIVN